MNILSFISELWDEIKVYVIIFWVAIILFFIIKAIIKAKFFSPKAMTERANKQIEKDNSKIIGMYENVLHRGYRVGTFTLESTGEILKNDDTGLNGQEGWEFKVEFSKEKSALTIKTNPVNPTCSYGFRAEELDEDSPTPKKIIEIKMGYLISKIVIKVEEISDGGKYLLGERFLDVLKPSINKCKDDDDFVLINNSIEDSIPVHKLISNAGEIIAEFDVSNLGWELGNKVRKDYRGNDRIEGIALNRKIAVSIGIEYIIADTYGWSMKTYKTSIENYKLKI